MSVCSWHRLLPQHHWELLSFTLAVLSTQQRPRGQAGGAHSALRQENILGLKRQHRNREREGDESQGRSRRGQPGNEG